MAHVKFYCNGVPSFYILLLIFNAFTTQCELTDAWLRAFGSKSVLQLFRRSSDSGAGVRVLQVLYFFCSQLRSLAYSPEKKFLLCHH